MDRADTRAEDDGSAAARGPSPAVFGDAVALMMASPAHKHLFLSDMEWLLLPPLVLGQYSLVRRHGKPVAFVSWAQAFKDRPLKALQPAPDGSGVAVVEW